MNRKRFRSRFYTQGRYGRGFREILDTDNPLLYSHGCYPTKLKAEDLPDDYIPIRGRMTWYLDGWLSTSGITDMHYEYLRIHHMIRDDSLYISYSGKLKTKTDEYGWTYFTNDDVLISGWDIVNIVLGAEKYSVFDTTGVRRRIEEKRIWLRDNRPDVYEHEVGFDEDIFEHWNRLKWGPEQLYR